jgi:flagellar biosynthesis/type III secretory pathway ATPase
LGTAIQSAIEEIDQIPDHRLYGRVDSVLGLVVEVAGLDRSLSVGERCRVIARNGQPVVCEAIDYYPRLEDFLRQDKSARAGLADGYAQLARILGMPNAPSKSPGAASETEPTKDQQS